ncbi:hypothetical protein NQZ79_g7203 [Umbelopsis isabellina]|nr:hypothetical protein NQZ79_g7203 [Umbelopsis isabellina]
MGANNSREATSPATSGASTPQKFSDLVDLGSLLPCGIYPSAPQDYDYRSVRKLIIDRRIAPFYKGLNDVPEIEEEPPAVANGVVENLSVPPAMPKSSSSTSTAATKRTTTIGRPRSASSSSVNSSSHAVSQNLAVDSAKERQRLVIERMKAREKVLYNDAVECPICFLYYPSNINQSRCCDQPICTECFIQIKRPAETPTTPASCPFCVEENFGVIYKPPKWSQIYERQQLPREADSIGVEATRNGATHTTSGKGTTHSKPRRQSVSHKDPEVILVDHIRPDWTRMVEVSRAPAGSRRNSATQANRSRGVGGTLGSILTRPGRSASSAASNEYYVSAAMRRMNLQSMDLEDLMVMEAVRLSLVEEEERRRREHQQQRSEQNESDSGNTTTSEEQPATVSGRRIEEEDEDEEDDDDDQPLYNTVVQNMRDRHEINASSDNSDAVNLNEAMDSPLPLDTDGLPSDETDLSLHSSNAPAETTELPAFELSNGGGSPQNRDHKQPIVVEGGDRSGLDGVSM